MYSRNKKKKGRRPCVSVAFQITTTPSIVNAIDRVLATGFYGTNRAGAAERLIGEAIRKLIQEGTILKPDGL